jgi:hypothetical protein
VLEDSWNSWELMNLKLFLQMTSNHRRVQVASPSTAVAVKIHSLKLELEIIPTAPVA